MTRYYFDISNGDGPIRDELGQEMADRNEISREVGRIVADIAREELPGMGEGAICVRVRDESGHQIFSGNLSFKTHWHVEKDEGENR